jgi:hypothetical protein
MPALARQNRPFLITALVLGAVIPVFAATTTKTAVATCTVTARAKLSLSSGTLSFPSADPDSTPAIPASGGALTITAKGRTTINSTVTLVVVASDDLLSSGNRIGIAALKWTVSGSGFVPGTMSKAAAQTVASFVSSGSWTGTQSYTLDNMWTYATGTYNTTLTYTLTAP